MRKKAENPQDFNRNPCLPLLRSCSWTFEPGPGVKRNFWIAKFLTSLHVRMLRVTFYISNTLTKLMMTA